MKVFRCGDSVIHDFRKRRLIQDVDYIYLMGDDLSKFRVENQKHRMTCLYIIFASGVEKITKYLTSIGIKAITEKEKIKSNLISIKKVLSDDIINSHPDMDEHITRFLKNPPVLMALEHFRTVHNLVERLGIKNRQIDLLEKDIKLLT